MPAGLWMPSGLVATVYVGPASGTSPEAGLPGASSTSSLVMPAVLTNVLYSRS